MGEGDEQTRDADARQVGAAIGQRTLVGDARHWGDRGRVVAAGDSIMRRAVVVGSLIVASFLVAAPAQADWATMKAKWHCFWDRVHLDWHRNNAWPEPFTLVDRQAVKVPIATMVDRGWQLQNTIPDELFDPETQTLTRAGELKVRWILTQMPAHRRDVFVLRGATPEITDLRLQSVEKLAADTVGGAPAMITVTDLIPRGGSASYYERVSTSFDATAPPPRLPAMDTGGGESQ